MKKSIKSTILFAAVMSISVFANAETKNKDDNKTNLYTITKSDIKSVPELSEGNQIVASSTNPTMKCLVDTPAWDSWGTSYCFSAGFARSATAYFQIDNMPSNFTVYWSDSRCGLTSSSCALSIVNYQQITLSATVLNHSTGTFSTTSSTAHYEGMH